MKIKSPSVPLFQRGNVSEKCVNPSWQRGEGKICVRNAVKIPVIIASFSHYETRAIQFIPA
jgi:hypothetical protein